MVRKRNYLLTLLVFSLLLLSGVSALSAHSTDITVRTEAHRQVEVAVTSEGISVQSFSGTSDEAGEFKARCISIPETLDMHVTVIKIGAVVVDEDYGPFQAGSPVMITALIPEEEIEEENDTIIEDIVPAPEVIIEDIDENSDLGVTGMAITEEDSGEGFFGKFFSTTLYYIVGGILLASVILVFAMQLAKKRRGHYAYFKYSNNEIAKPGSESNEESQLPFADDRIDRLEKTVRAAQSELNRIKNEKRIKEAERKLQEDTEKLEKLKSGEED